ncbi:unnamed protein product [Colletotrichum noveboracense]|uniref:Uncharacterized protein n=1 Tax=Colletotrichum noveboracense TaxID=2664923 RepID=A0A9W4WLP9_9PEZI|nr:unnamed protein product [Colletotrichum noveboracense]
MSTLFSQRRISIAGFWRRQNVSARLCVTGILSLVLLISDSRGWALDPTWYESSLAENDSTCSVIRPIIQLTGSVLNALHINISKRAAFELVARLAAYAITISHVSAIAYLIHNNVLSGFLANTIMPWSDTKREISHRNLGTRRDVYSTSLSWIVILSIFGVFSSALWTGAIMPTRSTAVVAGSIAIPSFANTTFIKDYVADTNDGTSTSSISPNLLKSLIGFKLSASRQPKLDNTDYIFEGRMYGVASSVGITDNGLKKSVRKYRFEEVGYLPQVGCLYNSSTNFRIGKEYPHRTFAVTGFLPDSVGSAQWSEYIGATSDFIVAIGVADSPQSPRRYISIAAGEKYRVLNTTQCTVDFVPTWFQVTVDVKDKSVGVVPMSGVDVQDIDPERILTRSAARELDSMSNSLQSFSGSVLGDALLASIAAWNSSFNAQGLVSERDATLSGLEHAFAVMTDSILAGYGQIQLGHFSKPTTAEVEVDVYVLGKKAFTSVAVLINAAITVAFYFNIPS